MIPVNPYRIIPIKKRGCVAKLKNERSSNSNLPILSILRRRRKLELAALREQMITQSHPVSVIQVLLQSC
jgi:hypothetical protein